jgi:hypothetical protein
MKKSMFLIVSLMVMVLNFVACSSSDNNGNVTPYEGAWVQFQLSPDSSIKIHLDETKPYEMAYVNDTIAVSKTGRIYRYSAPEKTYDITLSDGTMKTVSQEDVINFDCSAYLRYCGDLNLNHIKERMWSDEMVCCTVYLKDGREGKYPICKMSDIYQSNYEMYKSISK